MGFEFEFSRARDDLNDRTGSPSRPNGRTPQTKCFVGVGNVHPFFYFGRQVGF